MFWAEYRTLRAAKPSTTSRAAPSRRRDPARGSGRTRPTPSAATAAPISPSGSTSAGRYSPSCSSTIAASEKPASSADSNNGRASRNPSASRPADPSSGRGAGSGGGVDDNAAGDRERLDMPGSYRALTETTNVAHSAPSHRTALHNQKVIGSNLISDCTSQQLRAPNWCLTGLLRDEPLETLSREFVTLTAEPLRGARLRHVLPASKSTRTGWNCIQ